MYLHKKKSYAPKNLIWRPCKNTLYTFCPYFTWKYKNCYYKCSPAYFPSFFGIISIEVVFANFLHGYAWLETKAEFRYKHVIQMWGFPKLPLLSFIFYAKFSTVFTVIISWPPLITRRCAAPSKIAGTHRGCQTRKI